MLAAKVLIEELINQGVDFFCIAPGSRSTPLAIAIAENEKAENVVHYDERGLGFYGLGHAKALGKPVCVVVTSGTAVANLMPCVIEASLDMVPLIILSADRPTELRDCGSNQTIDQVHIFGRHVRYFIELPSYELTPSQIATGVSQAVYRSKTHLKGPVHINCLFREPLVVDDEGTLPSWTSTSYSVAKTEPEDKELELVVKDLQNEEKGVILLGSLSSIEDASPLYDLAEKLGWPLLASVLSCCRYDQNTIPYFYPLLKDPDFRPDVILQFGERFIGRDLVQYIKTSNAKQYIVVANHPLRQDPDHLVTKRIEMDPVDFAKKAAPKIQRRSSWKNHWEKEVETFPSVLGPFFESLPSATEPGLFFHLAETITLKYSLFIGNSMPIRDAEKFFFPKKKVGQIFANRGASGIDGNIATIAGIAAGSKKGVVAIIGDQTALHDLNSLPLIKESAYPIILIIINNGGGGIFSFLSVRSKTKLLDRYFAASHNLQFQKAAEMFSLPYFSYQENFSTGWLEDMLDKGQSCIVEMTTDRSENYDLHKEIETLFERAGICSQK